MHTSSEVGLDYRKVNRDVRKKMKVAKEEWIEEQCRNIEKGMMSGNSKEEFHSSRVLQRTKPIRQEKNGHKRGAVTHHRNWKTGVLLHLLAYQYTSKSV